MNYCFDFFKRYIDYGGVSNKKEFWFPMLMHLIVYFVLFILGIFLFNVATVLSLLYGLATIVPFTSSAVRRLHDADRSGYNLFYILIPVVGLVFITVMLCDKTKYNPYSFEIEDKENNNALQEENAEKFNKKENENG